MLVKQIILLVDSSQYGGIEAHILNLCILMQQRRIPHKVVFIRQHQTNPLLPKLQSESVVTEILSGTTASLWQFLKLNRNTSVVHTHGYRAGILARTFCRALSIHCVSTYHAGETGTGKLRLYNLVDRFSSFLSKNIAVSAAIQKQVRNAQQMDNFIPYIPPEHYRHRKHLRVGFVGRISEEKGPDIFLQMAKSWQNDSELSFHCYGGGPMMENLANMHCKNLTFHGFQSNMNAVWKNIDVLVISSRQEGMPMVAIEAMMRSIPVICSPVGELPTLLKNNIRGVVSEQVSLQSLIVAFRNWRAKTDTHKANLVKNAHQYVADHCSGKHQWKILDKIYSVSK
jgi:glycosyltransferase involved in cell wall biosynthesis